MSYHPSLEVVSEDDDDDTPRPILEPSIAETLLKGKTIRSLYYGSNMEDSIERDDLVFEIEVESDSSEPEKGYKLNLSTLTSGDQDRSFFLLPLPGYDDMSETPLVNPTLEQQEWIIEFARENLDKLDSEQVEKLMFGRPSDIGEMRVSFDRLRINEDSVSPKGVQAIWLEVLVYDSSTPKAEANISTLPGGSGS